VTFGLRHHGVRLLVLASVAALAVAGAWAWRTGGQRPARPGAALAALQASIVEVEAGRRTTPLIGGPTSSGDLTVTFLAKSARGPAPRIVSDVTGWGERADGTFDSAAGAMARIAGTDWYALQANVAPGARVEYLVAYGATDYRLDPHNPRQSEGPQLGGQPASEFVAPGYRPPEELAKPPASPAGLVKETTVNSPALRGSCRITVYTPAGYRADGGSPVAVFLDARAGQMSRVIDWLIAHRAIEPIVALFVGPNPGGHDTCSGAEARGFLAGDLLAWAASRYGTTRSADGRAILGISYGAKDALDVALTSPGAFGRLGLLIPGRRIGRADIDAIAGRPTHRLRVAILAGRYDQANIGTARSLRQSLTDAGHVVDYAEVPEGHNASTWRNHLRAVLVGLFGTRANEGRR
jgi:enterochelin esterase-like enzyme